jgi:transcriptional regulator with XRE-family HTH domain
MTVPTSQRTTVNSQEANYFKALGARIAQARKAQGLNQTQLADQLGLAQQTYAFYELGRVRFPASILPLLHQILGLTPEELLGHDAKPKLKRGPVSQLDRQIERIRRLPRAKQQILMDVIDGVLTKMDH